MQCIPLRPPASTVVVTLTSCGCSHPNCISAPIGTLNTLAFVENQIKDFCEHAHTCYFGCHGRTSFPRYRNFADCHPSVPVDPFESLRHTRFFHCLWHWHPRRISPPSMFQNYCICLSFGRQSGPVFGFLIVFPEDVFHVVISLRVRVGVLPVPPRVQCFLDLAHSSSVLLSQRMLTIDPLTCHLIVST